MTGLLASVATLDEMEAARVGGADIVDLKNPAQGALGAWDDDALHAAVARWRGWGAGPPRLSATIGDLPMDPSTIRDAATRVAAMGVPMVKLGVLPGGDPRACLDALKPLAGRADLIAVFFADLGVDLELLPAVASAGFRGAMIDTADKSAGGLRRHLGDAELGRFIVRARALGLMSGLAGSLNVNDVTPLAALGPDYLGFRGALCKGGRTGRFDPGAMARIRGLLIPPRGGGRAARRAAA